MLDDMYKNAFLGIRVEVTVYAEEVVDGRQLCSGLDLLHLEAIESVLGGSFDTKGASIDFLEELSTQVSGVGTRDSWESCICAIHSR